MKNWWALHIMMPRKNLNFVKFWLPSWATMRPLQSHFTWRSLTLQQAVVISFVFHYFLCHDPLASSHAWHMDVVLCAPIFYKHYSAEQFWLRLCTGHGSVPVLSSKNHSNFHSGHKNPKTSAIILFSISGHWKLFALKPTARKDVVIA